MKRIVLLMVSISLTLCLTACGNSLSDIGLRKILRENVYSFDVSSPDEEIKEPSTSGTTIVYKLNVDKPDTEKDFDVIAVGLLTSRLDALGYANANVVINNSEIEVTLPEAVDNIEQLAKEIKEIPTLKFVDCNDNVILTGDDIVKVVVRWNKNIDDPVYNIGLDFTEKGKTKFREASSDIAKIPAPNNYINIMLDDVTIASPTVSREIDTTSIVEFGGFTDSEQVNTLATQIDAARNKFSLDVLETY